MESFVDAVISTSVALCFLVLLHKFSRSKKKTNHAKVLLENVDEFSINGMLTQRPGTPQSHRKATVTFSIKKT